MLKYLTRSVQKLREMCVQRFPEVKQATQKAETSIRGWVNHGFIEHGMSELYPSVVFAISLVMYVCTDQYVLLTYMNSMAPCKLCFVVVGVFSPRAEWHVFVSSITKCVFVWHSNRKR